MLWQRKGGLWIVGFRVWGLELITYAIAKMDSERGNENEAGFLHELTLNLHDLVAIITSVVVLELFV